MNSFVFCRRNGSAGFRVQISKGVADKLAEGYFVYATHFCLVEKVGPEIDFFAAHPISWVHVEYLYVGKRTQSA